MKLYLAVFSGNLGMVCVGMVFGWASPSLPLLLRKDSPVPLTLEQASWVVSLLTMGGTFGSLNCAFLANRIGRKNTMLLTALPCATAWLLIAFATAPWQLYLSRFISGIGTGTAYATTSIYLGEISPAQTRGVMASLLTVAAKSGSLIEFAMGPFLTVKNLALVSLSAPVLFFLTFVWLPESPYHLMRQGRYKEAVEALRQLRNNANVTKEAEIIANSVEADLANETGFREITRIPGNRKALIVVLGLIAVQQLSGSQVVLSYAQTIFDAAGTNFEGKYLTIILGTVQVVSTIVAAMTTDRCGRRPLLIVSCLGTAFATTTVGLYFFLEHIGTDTQNITWMPAFGAILYIVMYSAGLAGIPFTMMGELFPTNVKALGNTLAMFCCNACAFAVTISYQSIIDHLGVYSAFWIFAGLSLVGYIFVLVYVPETKGKTLQEIQKELHNTEDYA